MSAATEQNNGDVAVEKIAADAIKDDLKSQKAIVEDSKPVVADNGIASKEEIHEDDTAPAKEHVKGTKRPSEVKNSESKKAKKEKDFDSDEEGIDEEEIIDDDGSEIESDDYDIPYDGEDDDIGCEDDDDDDDGSGSDDQA